MVSDDDPVAQRLREAVWADPSADAPRMVYADYLIEQGDPLGELIALQLERARTGEVVSERERELMLHGQRMVGPVQRWLAGWRLDRGFLSSFTPGVDAFPPEVVDDPVWSTAERVTFEPRSDHAILESRKLRSLRTLVVDDHLAARLSRRTRPLPCVALATRSYRELSLDSAETFDHLGAFDNVRSISIAGSYDLSYPRTRDAMARRLFSQLDHLDLKFYEPLREGSVRRWSEWFETTQLARLSVQGPLQDDLSESVGSYDPSEYISIEVDRAGGQAILQLDDATYRGSGLLVGQIVAALARSCRRVLVEDLRDSNHCAERHADVLAELRSTFDEVVVATGPVRSRAP